MRQVEYILKKGNNRDIQKLHAGTKSIYEVYKTIYSEEIRRKLIKSKSLIDLPQNCKLYQGDFVEKSRLIPDNSIHLIITDPPFNNIKKNVEIFKELGRVAERVLVDVGSLISYVGTYALPEFIKSLTESGLIYHWTICVRYNGNHAQMHQKKVFVHWKPMVWLIKGKKISNYVQSIDDVIEPSPPKESLS